MAPRPPAGPWVAVDAHSEPEVVAATDIGDPLPVEVVEWVHSHWSAPKRQRSTLAAWRRWARGGTVLHLGSAGKK